MTEALADSDRRSAHVLRDRSEHVQRALVISYPGQNSGGGGGGGSASGKTGAIPNTTPGTLGVNPQGQTGSYSATGQFTLYFRDDERSPAGRAACTSRTRLVATATIDANTQNMSINDHQALMIKGLAIAGMPITDDNIKMLDVLINHESGWNPNAINNWDSNAAAGHPSQGLMQTIPGTFENNRNKQLPDKITNPIANIVAGLNYIKNRYGALANLAGEKSVASGGGWIGYATGALFNAGPQNIQVGERGPEAVLPLNNRGVDFLLSMARQLNTDGWQARNSNAYATKLQPTISTTTVDSSTNFTGPITVEAQDPNAMANALKNKARMQALTRPDLATGVLPL